ncbi:MAG: arylesterase [Burkholderiales bacterium]|nr:arylesterase [Burkholderiales bacterium]
MIAVNGPLRREGGRRAAGARARALALLACIALAGCGAKTPALPALGPQDVVLAFGDSLTFGTGARADQSYPAVLAGLIGRKVVAAGVPGEVSANGLARLPGALEAAAPRLLVLCHGGNDLLRRLDEAELAANLRAMIGLARSRGVAVVLVAVPKPGLFPDAHPVYAAVADELGVPLERDVLKAILTDNELKSDQVHPNARGYARLAEAVAGLLRKAKAL